MPFTKKLLVVSLFLCMASGTFSFGAGQAQEGTGTDRLAYFGDTMRPDFRQDIVDFSNAPLYTLNAQLVMDAEKTLINGQLTVEYTNQSPDNLNDIVFRLYPNLDSFAGETTVSTIMVDGAPTVPTFDDTSSIMTVRLPATLPSSATVSLSMGFQTIAYANVAQLYSQFSYLNGALALPDFIPLLSVYETGVGWWQNISHPQGDAVYSETSFFDVTLTAPSELVIITSGIQVERQENGDGTDTHHYLAALMRDFALMASTRYESISDTEGDVLVDVHYLAGDEDGALAVLDYAKDAIRIYTALFGPYPYAELDIVETYTTAGGIEYPGLIVIQDDAWREIELYLEIVTAHEVAHQWWYSIIGNDQTRNPWLDESLAQYSTALYFGNVYGPDVQASVFEQYTNDWQGFIQEQNDQPIGLPVATYPMEAYFPIVYEKGPLFFATLAEMFGEDAVLAALSDYFLTYRYRIVTSADLQASLEFSLGRDLDALFLEWVGQG